MKAGTPPVRPPGSLQPLRVIHLATETPHFRTGRGLADVMGSVPGHERSLGTKSCIMTVGFRGTTGLPDKPIHTLSVQDFSGTQQTLEVRRTHLPDTTPVLFFCHDAFDREKPYDHDDDVQRFALSALGMLDYMKTRLTPQVIVAHDWQMAMVVAYLKLVYKEDPVLGKVKTIFTPHDLAFQGCFPAQDFKNSGLPWQLSIPNAVEFYGWVSLLKAGLNYSDLVAVRSTDYSQWIQMPEHGRRFDGLFREIHAQNRLVALLPNDSLWNPKMGPLSPEAAHEYAQREIGAIRTIYGEHFPGDEQALPPLSKDNRLYLYQSPLEKLTEVNPALHPLYTGFGEAERAVVDKFVGNGQAHVFARISTPEELATMVSDLGKIDLERFAMQQGQLSKFIATSGRSNAPDGRIELIENIPPHDTPDLNDLELGRKSYSRLFRAVPAGGAATRFFNGLQKAKAIFSITELEGKNFLQIQEDDCVAAQNKYNVSVPYFVLVSPGVLGSEMRDDLTARGYSLHDHPNPRLWIYGQPKTELEVVMFELNLMLPTMSANGQLSLSADGKRVRLAPPGHGIFYETMVQTGAYEEAAKRNRDIMAMSNIDNLGFDIQSDFYASILGGHVRSNAKFTAEMVEPRNDDGGIGITVDGKARIGERFAVPPGVWDDAQNSHSPFNPVNYTMALDAVQKGAAHLPWIVERKRTDSEFFQTVILAGDASSLMDTRFLQVPRQWRFIPNKMKGDVPEAAQIFLNKWASDYR